MRILNTFAFFAVLFSVVGCSVGADDPTDADEGEVKKLSSASFECKVKKNLFGDGKTHSVAFALSGLDGNTDSLAWAGASKKAEEDANDETLALTTVPSDSELAFLYDNYNVTLEKNELKIFGDSDGIQLNTLVLYKDSGFKRGYYRVEDISGDGQDRYSTVSCTVKALK